MALLAGAINLKLDNSELRLSGSTQVVNPGSAPQECKNQLRLPTDSASSSLKRLPLPDVTYRLLPCNNHASQSQSQAPSADQQRHKETH